MYQKGLFLLKLNNPTVSKKKIRAFRRFCLINIDHIPVFLTFKSDVLRTRNVRFGDANNIIHSLNWEGGGGGKRKITKYFTFCFSRHYCLESYRTFESEADGVDYETSLYPEGNLPPQNVITEFGLKVSQVYKKVNFFSESQDEGMKMTN